MLCTNTPTGLCRSLSLCIFDFLERNANWKSACVRRRTTNWLTSRKFKLKSFLLYCLLSMCDFEIWNAHRPSGGQWWFGGTVSMRINSFNCVVNRLHSVSVSHCSGTFAYRIDSNVFLWIIHEFWIQLYIHENPNPPSRLSTKAFLFRFGRSVFFFFVFLYDILFVFIDRFVLMHI